MPKVPQDGVDLSGLRSLTNKMPSIALGTTIVGPNGETFKTTDFLGAGAFGEVYRAVGETTGTVVAVKLLPVGKLASAGI